MDDWDRRIVGTVREDDHSAATTNCPGVLKAEEFLRIDLL